MKIDLHNHTPLCKHATGTPSEYLAQALKEGIATYGFACHAPMDFDPAYRMSFEELPVYFDMVDAARREFRGKIEVLTGLEVDFIKGRSDLLDVRVLDAKKVDFLIGSVHFIDASGELWGFDNPEFIAKYAQIDIERAWNLYVEANIALAQSRLFDIIGHIDLLKIFGNHPPKSLAPRLLQMLEAIRENGLVMELNAAGLRKKVAEQYPSTWLLEQAHKMEIPITFSSDAHAIEQVAYAHSALRDLALRTGYTHAAIFRERNRVMVEI